MTGGSTPSRCVVQDGDLGTWDKPRILLVLEGCLCRVVFDRKRQGIRMVDIPADPDAWEWGITTVKTIMRYSWNSVPVEVITFLSQDVADLAAVWFNRYDVEVSETAYYHYDRFCRSLMWRRNNIQEIIDADQERVLRYGQLGRVILFDGEF
jgi:hypothetical protein